MALPTVFTWTEEHKTRAKFLGLNTEDEVDAYTLAMEVGMMGCVQAADRIEDSWERSKLLTRMVIHCRQLGFDVSNRDFTLGNGLEVKSLMSDIAALGWSTNEVAHAICVELEPGDKECEAANRNFALGSLLAPVRLQS